MCDVLDIVTFLERSTPVQNFPPSYPSPPPPKLPPGWRGSLTSELLSILEAYPCRPWKITLWKGWVAPSFGRDLSTRLRASTYGAAGSADVRARRWEQRRLGQHHASRHGAFCWPLRVSALPVLAEHNVRGRSRASCHSAHAGGADPRCSTPNERCRQLVLVWVDLFDVEAADEARATRVVQKCSTTFSETTEVARGYIEELMAWLVRSVRAGVQSLSTLLDPVFSPGED